MSSDVRARAKLTSAGHLDRHELSITRRRLPNMCCAINFEGSCRRRTPSGVGSLAVVSGGGNPQYCPWGVALFTTLASQIELPSRNQRAFAMSHIIGGGLMMPAELQAMKRLSSKKKK